MQLFWIVLSFVLLSTLGQAQDVSPAKRFKLPPVLREASGLWLQSADSLWWINDSGDGPFLYLTNGQGHLTAKKQLPGIRNVDWEELADAPDGTLFIGDFGNNRNQRKDLKIYRFHPETEALDSIIFEYPDQNQFPPSRARQNFDMEAFVWYRDSLHLFSKNKLGNGNYYTKHYRLPATPGRYTATLIDSIYLKNRVVTAAAVSPDGQSIALLAYTFKRVLGFLPFSAASVFHIRNFEGSQFFQGEVYKSRVPAFLLSTQYESLDFLDDQTIYVASEQTAFIKPKAKRIKLKARHFKERKQIMP